MVKIIYFLTSFTCGGAEMGALRILSELVKDKKYDITLVTLENKGELFDQFIYTLPCRSFNFTNKLNIFKIWQIYGYLKKENPDIVIASLFHPVILTRLLKPLIKYKLMTWEHSIDFGNKLRRGLKKATQRRSDIIIGDSQAVCSILKKEFHVLPNNVRYVPIGCVDLNKFKPKNKINKILKIGSVGRLDTPKGYEYLIDAASILKKNYSDFVIEIVGEGKLSWSLLQQIDRLDLHEHVKLLGYRPDIENIMPSWDIYVQPSLWEGQCMTVIEAAACGLPIVASNVGGIPETVKHKINGLLVEPKDVITLHDALLALIVGSLTRKEFGKNSRKIAEEKYDSNIMIKEIKKLIDLLILP